MECKSVRRKRKNTGKQVLIETLWNVNAISCRIRNGSGRVLIETLWNVNNFEPSTEQRPVAVLIETLWTVNSIAELREKTVGMSFNRNIVECKSVPAADRCRGGERF